MRRLEKNISLFKNKEITEEQLESRINGWMGYAKFADTWNFRKKINIYTKPHRAIYL